MQRCFFSRLAKFIRCLNTGEPCLEFFFFEWKKVKISKVNHCVRTLKLDAEEVKDEGKEGEGKKPDCQTMVPNLLDTTTDGRLHISGAFYQLSSI